VEFNTETGAELRKWRKGATEPFCVSSTGESLVMFGADPNNEYLRRIRHVNLATGIETVVFKGDEAMLYSCFTGARPEFNPSVSGTHAFTSNTYHYFGDTVLSYEIDLDNGPTSLTKISNSFITWLRALSRGTRWYVCKWAWQHP